MLEILVTINSTCRGGKFDCTGEKCEPKCKETEFLCLDENVSNLFMDDHSK